MAFTDRKDGPANKGHKKLSSSCRARCCCQGPGNGGAALSILEEPRGIESWTSRLQGRKRLCSLSGCSGDAHPLVPESAPGQLPSAPLGLLSPKKNAEAFSVVWKIILRCLNLSTIVYRANYFIFIVNLSVEEMISKI